MAVHPAQKHGQYLQEVSVLTVELTGADTLPKIQTVVLALDVAARGRRVYAGSADEQERATLGNVYASVGYSRTDSADLPRPVPQTLQDHERVCLPAVPDAHETSKSHGVEGDV